MIVRCRMVALERLYFLLHEKLNKGKKSSSNYHSQMNLFIILFIISFCLQLLAELSKYHEAKKCASDNFFCGCL